MLYCIFDFLEEVDAFFWGYIGFSAIGLLGVYLTVHSRFFQIRSIPIVLKSFWTFCTDKRSLGNGTHPLKVFFSSAGGMLGVGNIIGVVTALQLGGPGAIFWVWLAAFLGSLIKYCEVFLGLKYRVVNGSGGYDGGSIYLVKRAFNLPFIGILCSMLLCLYCTEIYQFSVLVQNVSHNLNQNSLVVAVVLLGIVFYPVLGGIKRVGTLCSILMPLFAVLYVGLCLWALVHYLHELPGHLKDIFAYAFTGQGVVGGAAGGSLLIAVQQGTSRSVYSADIGIGYDSIIQSETSVMNTASQAYLAVLGVLFDNLICTLSLLVALATGFWKVFSPSDAFLVVQEGLSAHVPHIDIFMPAFLFILVYSTLISLLFVGAKCARYVFPRHGEKLYFVFAPLFLLFFSFVDQTKALLIMSLSGGMLLIINLAGVFLLRREIDFTLPEEKTAPALT